MIHTVLVTVSVTKMWFQIILYEAKLYVVSFLCTEKKLLTWVFYQFEQKNKKPFLILISSIARNS